MRKIIAALLIVAFIASTNCWETECLIKVLDVMSSEASAEKFEKANAALVTAFNKGEILEAYDTHLHYNTDFKDRMGEDIDQPSFGLAERNIGIAYVSKVSKVTVSSDLASGQYYYYGVCCYFFNPCVALKIGYHLSIPVTAAQVKLDEQTFIDSLVKSKSAFITAVLKKKDQLTPKKTTTA